MLLSLSIIGSLSAAQDDVGRDEIPEYTLDRFSPEDAIGMEMTQNTLAGFRFEGLKLGASLDEFQRMFPAAKKLADRIDAKSGLTCYTVSKLKSADGAQFYFVDGKLYQMEIEYGRERILKSGGLEAVVRKVVAAFGNADNIYRNRRTWHQQTIARRADFYTRRDGGAQLVMTDTSLQARIDARQKRTALEDDVKLGF